MRNLMKESFFPAMNCIKHAKQYSQISQEINAAAALSIEEKLKMIAELSQKYGYTIPDNAITELNSPQKIVAMFEAQKDVNASFKGIPELELLRGQELPPNIQLYNYRKKRWSNQVYARFVAKAYAQAESSSDK